MVSVDWLSCLPVVACKAALMLGGYDAGTGCAGWGFAALNQALVPPSPTNGLHATKEAMSSRSFADHIFKIIVDQRSCLQGQG